MLVFFLCTVNCSVDSSNVIWQWMARWAAMSYNRFQRGADGKTAYQRQLGRACSVEVVPFGERVMYKTLKTGGKKKEASESKWSDGI